MILINTNILDMVLDLVQIEVLHIQVGDMEKILFLELVWKIQNMLITEQEAFWC